MSRLQEQLTQQPSRISHLGTKLTNTSTNNIALHTTPGSSHKLVESLAEAGHGSNTERAEASWPGSFLFLQVQEAESGRVKRCEGWSWTANELLPTLPASKNARLRKQLQRMTRAIRVLEPHGTWSASAAQRGNLCVTFSVHTSKMHLPTQRVRHAHSPTHRGTLYHEWKLAFGVDLSAVAPDMRPQLELVSPPPWCLCHWRNVGRDGRRHGTLTVGTRLLRGPGPKRRILCFPAMTLSVALACLVAASWNPGRWNGGIVLDSAAAYKPPSAGWTLRNAKTPLSMPAYPCWQPVVDKTVR